MLLSVLTFFVSLLCYPPNFSIAEYKARYLEMSFLKLLVWLKVAVEVSSTKYEASDLSTTL